MSLGITAAGLGTFATAVAPTVIGGLLGGKGGGQAQGGTQTVNRDPWLPAQDWMKQNLATGQNLQNYYQANPFNGQQQAAYRNLASGTDYINRLTPGLLQQFSQPTGFDRNNPTARPSPFNFAAPGGFSPMAHAYGGVMEQSVPGVSAAKPFMLQADAAPQGSSDIQKMIADALAKQQALQSPYQDINAGNGGGG